MREIHNVRVMQVDGGFELSLHVKLPRNLSLADAHDTVEQLEAAIREAVPELRDGPHAHRAARAAPTGRAAAAARRSRSSRAAIEDVVRRYTGRDAVQVRFRDAERGRVALITVLLPADQPLPSAHRRAGEIEHAVRERCPDLERRHRPHRARRRRRGAAPIQRRLIAAESADRDGEPRVPRCNPTGAAGTRSAKAAATVTSHAMRESGTASISSGLERRSAGPTG